MKAVFNQKEYENELNNQLAEILNKYIIMDSNIKASMIYSLLDGGKRIRPMLFNLILEAYQIQYSNYKNAACAIEMIHTYSLVHDDLPAMDNDLLRRGKPTTHIRFDEATAILCGDALLTEAFSIICELDLEANKVLEIIKVLANKSGANGMIYGQSLDMNQTDNISIDDLETTHYYKTCCLIQASMMMAAIISEKNTDDFELLGKYLGLAFQAQDDILEYTQTSEQLGKDNSSDMNNSKVTIVSLLGIKHAQTKVIDYFSKIDELLNKLSLKDTNFHKLILNIADRDK